MKHEGCCNESRVLFLSAGRMWGLCVTFLCLAMPASHGQWVQLVNNPSFEADGLIHGWPHYIASPSDITGWTATTGSGIAGSDVPGAFYSPALGEIPHGAYTFFQQGDGVLSQTITGLKHGRSCRLHFYLNCREGNSGLNLTVSLGSEVMFGPELITTTAQFRYVDLGEFLYDSGWGNVLTFAFQNPGGDNSVLLDAVALEALSLYVTADSATRIIAAPGDLPITFAVKVENFTGPLTYQWYREQLTLDGETNPYLTLEVSEGNEGRYHCRVYDAGTDEFADSPEFQLIVGTLPVGGLSGIVLTGIVITVLGLGTVRRRR